MSVSFYRRRTGGDVNNENHASFVFFSWPIREQGNVHQSDCEEKSKARPRGGEARRLGGGKSQWEEAAWACKAKKEKEKKKEKKKKEKKKKTEKKEDVGI